MARQPTIKVLFIAAVNEDAAKPHMPTFVSLLVKVNKDEYVRGYQFDYAEEMLKEKGYGEPFVILAEEEAPKWLMDAFNRGDIKGVAPAAYRRAVFAREKVFAEKSG